MLRPYAVGIVTGALLLVAAGGSSCSKSSAGAGVAGNCSINSDCDSPYVCTFGRCHEQCAESRDCPSGERCVSSTTGGVCQLSQESTCMAGTICDTGEACGTDQQCRVQCTAAGGCIGGDYCLTASAAATGACYSASNSDDQPTLIVAGILAVDGAVIGDASVVVITPDGSGGSSGGPDGSGGGPDTGPKDAGNESSVTVNSCPNAQTQFGPIAQGDSNPYFKSGVGVRGAKSLYIFDGYSGPDPVNADAGNATYLYVQAFDPVTAVSKGPAQSLLDFGALAGCGSTCGASALQAAAIAPSGQVVVLDWVQSPQGLFALFFDTSADGGTPGLQLTRTVQLEASALVSQPAAIWSNAAGAFVFSWEYAGGGGPIKVQKYLPNGQSAGSGSDQVPTDNGNNSTSGYTSGYAAASGSLFGVAYLDNGGNRPTLTVLDAVGNEVGSTVYLAPPGGATWVTAGGSPAGFVTFYDQGGIGETFVPASTDGGVPWAQSDGGADAGFPPGFHFTGTKAAIYARALNDDVGGQNGVGVAILYSDGVAFAYVGADGLTHVGPNDMFAHMYAAGDFINITNYGGSFGVSLYTSTSKATEMAASGCATPLTGL